jgi:predicted AAA+ superfamily ATPase
MLFRYVSKGYHKIYSSPERHTGYPEALQRSSESRRYQWFESYLISLMQKNIQELSNIEGLTQIPNILQLIATRVGSTINF